MTTTRNKRSESKSRRPGASGRQHATRLTDLLGDFSEQTGAQFG